MQITREQVIKKVDKERAIIEESEVYKVERKRDSKRINGKGNGWKKLG